jgi:hypothetical protein
MLTKFLKMQIFDKTINIPEINKSHFRGVEYQFENLALSANFIAILLGCRWHRLQRLHVGENPAHLCFGFHSDSSRSYLRLLRTSTISFKISSLTRSCALRRSGTQNRADFRASFLVGSKAVIPEAWPTPF